jgi:carbohydrate kinase (thermoresistant glucokinase family)
MEEGHRFAEAGQIIVVMGVTGAGKTTVGQALAAELHIPFYDGDDFHSVANKTKMSQGQPLTDADRADWLAALRSLIAQHLAEGQSAVLACSALKDAYRQILRQPGEPVTFVYLRGSAELLQQRLGQRQGHFMNPRLLASQLGTLEEPEDSLVVDVSQPLEEIVATILAELNLQRCS